MPPPDPTDIGTLNPEQHDALSSLDASLSAGQRLQVARWLLMRLDGSALAEDRLETTAGGPCPGPRSGLTVLYGTHSGHSSNIARRLVDGARQRGWAVNLAAMADYAHGKLKREQRLAVIVSTHGEGEPPESAAAFFEFLQGSRAPQLDACEFAVLALGDKSYERFCQAGVDVDARLEQLGAKRLLARVDLDVDFLDGADTWVAQALDAFAPRVQTVVATDESVQPPRMVRFSRDNPYHAELLHRATLSGRGSTQCFVHLGLSLDGSNLRYLPGDALGVQPENDPAVVECLVSALGHDPMIEVQVSGVRCTLVEALTKRLEIQRILPSALRRLAARGVRGLAALAEKPEAATTYVEGRDWIDLLNEHPFELDADEFVSLLPELTSRSYSIASCQSEFPDEVHLLVSRVDFTTQGGRRHGVASGFLTHRVRVGDTVPVWIEPNSRFRLPENGDQPIVLIGAGTGIAPFRAFLQSREANQTRGKNWVIFGNRRFRTDFTYQTEWLRWRDAGVLTRMDTAFSRDQKDKIYVTDRMLQQSRELYDWLEHGAKIYLCGDRKRLAQSVDHALIDVVMKEGAKSRDGATEYLEQLHKETRYLKDVY